MIAAHTARRLVILGVLLILIAAAALVRFDQFRSTCPLYNLTGVPCPFCKMTSAWSLVLHGEIASGVKTNPLGVLFLLAGLTCVVYLLVALLRRLPPVAWDGRIARRTWLLWCFGIAWLANWVYVAIRVLR